MRNLGTARCKTCNTEFVKTSPNQKYCPLHGRAGLRASRRKARGKTITCELCGKTEPWTSTFQKYCQACQLANRTCPECGRVYPRRRSYPPTLCWSCYSKRKFASGHPNWQGGQYKRHGYVMVYQGTENGKTVYVLEHVLIWEKFHQRSLPGGWVIHHLNGIKDDNRIENLVALSSQAHSKVLAAKAKRIRELEKQLRELQQGLQPSLLPESR